MGLERRMRCSMSVSNRMLKKSASGVLAALRGSTYRRVRLASSFAAALQDGLFEHPVACSDTMIDVRRPHCELGVSIFLQPANPHIDFLASSRAVGYAHAHEQDGVEIRDRAVVHRSVGLCTDDEARVAEAGVRGRTIYAFGTGCHRGIRDGIVQQLEQGGHADEGD